MMADEKIKNSNELEFAVFCIENVAAKLGVDAECVYQAFTQKSDIFNGLTSYNNQVLFSREFLEYFFKKESGSKPERSVVQTNQPFVV